MADLVLMDKVFHFVMETWKERGQAPHYTEIAQAFSEKPQTGKKWLHELFGMGIPGWFFPDTDYIAAVVPLSNIPTQYRITVDGEQKWFGSCGFDAPAVSWLFPDKSISIDFPCLDCGEKLSVTVRNGTIEKSDTEDIFFYVDIPAKDWRGNLPYS